MEFEKEIESKWLIKSENKILGPYSYDQIIDLIRKKQISIIDEIRDLETRWLYIRENPKFKSSVEEIRKEMEQSPSEDTKTFQSVSKTEEVVLQTKTDFNEFTDLEVKTKDVDVVNEILSRHSNSESKNTPPTKLIKIKSYGVPTDQQVKQSVSQYLNKAIALVIILGLSAAITFFGYNHIQKKDSAKLEEEKIKLVKKYKFLGLYSRASEIFIQLPQSVQKKIMPELMELYPVIESSGAVDIAFINSISSESALTSEQKAMVELIHFNDAIKKNKISEAQDRMARATSAQPTSLLIKENEALLDIRIGRFQQAYNLFNNLIKQEINGRYLVGLSRAYFGMTQADRTIYTRELLSIIDKYTTVYYDYKKELLLAQMILSSELNDINLFKISKELFFNTPTRLSAEFTNPALLIANSYSWVELKYLRQQIQKKLSDDELILYQLHDFLELGQLSAASEFELNNKTKINNSEIKAQMGLLIYDVQRRHNDLLALEKSNKLNSNSELNHFIIAKNKIESGVSTDISIHINYLDSKRLYFYKDWLKLMKLTKNGSIPELKIFLNEHFITVPNFSPALLAKTLVN